MTNWVEWFKYQLKASGDGFTWAFEQISPAYQCELPPSEPLGLWSPLRHIWHVTEYERYIALPVMYQWLDKPKPDGNLWNDSDEMWTSVKDNPIEDFIQEFHLVRQQQIDLLGELETVDWTSTRDTFWGTKPLTMVVTKTYQHTFEHGDTLMRMSLWWEAILDHLESKKE